MIVPQRLTLEDYEALPEGRPYYEFDEGVLVELKSTHGSHGLFMGRIFAYLDTWTRHHGGYTSQEVGTIFSGKYGYIPDLVYLKPEHMHLLVDGRVRGIPDLAVEIHDRTGAGRDRVRKFRVYQKAGLPWYWLFDYESAVAEEYHLEQDRYVRTAEAGPGDVFTPQALPGLTIPMDDIRQVPTPPPKRRKR